MSINVKLYPTKSGNHRVWICRWYAGGKRGSKTLGKVKDIPKREAEAQRKELEDSFTKGEQSPISVKSMSLKQFIDQYADRRRQEGNNRGYLREAPRLSEASITSHMMTLRYMRQHFGESRAIGSITLTDASDFIDALANGNLVSARKTKQQFGLSKQTIRCHIRNSKAILNWAVLFEIVNANPFAKFDGKVLATEPNHYVELSDFRKLFNAAPDRNWAMLFAICRLAGLRLSAARTLPWFGHAADSDGKRHWVGIDWDRRRICVVGNHKTTRRYRELPIRPLLYRLLRKTFKSSKARFQHPQSGQSESITGLGPNNLTRTIQKSVQAAGIKPWPKLYQAMRSSCENDHKMRGVAEATYAAWMGHSPTVSRQHYTSPTEAEYKAATRVA